VPNICINCVKEPTLKQLVKNEGVNGTCFLCGSSNLILDTENDRFFQLTKALVRFHYSEWDYNEHWGGDGYSSLFYGEDNRFFDENRSNSDELYEEIVLSIIEGSVYEDYDKGISIFAGYAPDGSQNMLLQSIKSDLDNDILIIADRLKTENHFALEKVIKTFLEKYRSIATSNIVVSDSLYRARVGFKEKKQLNSASFVPEFHYSPYTGIEIGAPPPYLAIGGRANRTGVSFLYCATNQYTAISEVRPHPGDNVSLAKFHVNHDISVFDLSESKILHFFESDKSLDSYKSFNTLDVLLNRTTPPSDRTHYSITQLIVDCIRQLDFDGVVFNSTVGSGKNIVLFNQEDVTQVPGETDIVLIDSVKYEYNHEKIVNDDDDYY